jgi:hypothetical protein
MSRFQNKNKVWISNTLKSNSETLGIIKLLKDIGVFREKPKKRKPKKSAKEEEDMEDDEEFLMPPTGGGGGGASVGLLPTSNITQALQALKSGVSSQAQQQNLLEKAKEDLQLQYGRMIDLSQIQNRPALGFQASAPQIDWLEEETGTDFFPEKEAVVSEAPQEFKQETSGTDIPQDVLDIDVSEKVGEEGIMEDDEEEEEAFTPSPPEIPISEKFKTLADQYGLRSVRKDMTVQELKNYIIDLYFKFNRKAPRTTISRMRKDEVKKAITDLIVLQYDSIYS